MKKIIIGLLAALLFYASCYAQKGSSYIGAGADFGIPTGESANNVKAGMGFYVKALLGVGHSGQVSFTSGYSTAKAVAGIPLKTGTAPFLVGYRANFNGFFVEPQLGYAIINARFEGIEDVAPPEQAQGGLVMWAAGIGYVFNNKIEVGARYQSGSNNGGTWTSFGLRLGYNFSLNGSKK